MKHGLAIGKFYPPHAGHHWLIRQAAARCDHVSVIVMASSVESIPLQDRVAWLRAEHTTAAPGCCAGRPAVEIIGVTDDLEVDYDSPAAWAGHVALMEAALARAVLERDADPADAAVDLVVASEPYGTELARRFGAQVLLLDVDRTTYPVSGTAVRDDVVGCWTHLAPPVRAGLARRVVVLGAESTGTTTVSRALAERMQARGGIWHATGWVPEYGRDYTLGKLEVAAVLAERTDRPRPGMDDLTWSTEDFITVATRQQAMEDAAAAAGGPVLICDTDAFATRIWHRRYLGADSPAVTTIAERRPNDLYLLTDHRDVPFVQDGIRDGEHLRAWMTDEFAAELTATGRRWTLLTGSIDHRVRAGLAAIDDLLELGWHLADPLPTSTDGIPAAGASARPRSPCPGAA